MSPACIEEGRSGEEGQIEPDNGFLDPQANERMEIQAYVWEICDELLKPPLSEISPKPLIAPLACRDRWVQLVCRFFCTASLFLREVPNPKG